MEYGGVEIMNERKSIYVRIRGKRILVIGDPIRMPRVFFHLDTPKAVWLDPT